MTSSANYQHPHPKSFNIPSRFKQKQKQARTCSSWHDDRTRQEQYPGALLTLLSSCLRSPERLREGSAKGGRPYVVVSWYGTGEVDPRGRVSEFVVMVLTTLEGHGITRSREEWVSCNEVNVSRTVDLPITVSDWSTFWCRCKFLYIYKNPQIMRHKAIF